MTFDYTAFGLVIDSDIELPELVSASRPDAVRDPMRTLGVRKAVVRLGQIDVARESPTSGSDRVLAWARRGDVCLDYSGIARYQIVGGERITVEPADGASARMVRLFLIGPAFALLLHQRGLLVLHASGVNVGERAIALVGEKGEGKSTLAASLHARGHPLVSDDLMSLDLGQQDCVRVSPGYPHCKLLPDATMAVERMDGARQPVHVGSHEEGPSHAEAGAADYPKQAYSACADFSGALLPLGAVFVLGTGDRERIELLPPQERFVELVRHSYLAPLMERTCELADHFRQVVELAQRVPVFRLERRRDLDRLPAVASLIEHEAARLP
jgi:hypothetical protein